MQVYWIGDWEQVCLYFYDPTKRSVLCLNGICSSGSSVCFPVCITRLKGFMGIGSSTEVV